MSCNSAMGGLGVPCQPSCNHHTHQATHNSCVKTPHSTCHNTTSTTSTNKVEDIKSNPSTELRTQGLPRHRHELHSLRQHTLLHANTMSHPTAPHADHCTQAAPIAREKGVSAREDGTTTPKPSPNTPCQHSTILAHTTGYRFCFAVSVCVQAHIPRHGLDTRLHCYIVQHLCSATQAASQQHPSICKALEAAAPA
jgi:hypothetical protein